MLGKKSAEPALPAQMPGRNDPCHCGSGKKYKKCCETSDEAKTHAVHEKTWEKAEKEFEKLKKDAEKKAGDPGAHSVIPGVHGNKPPTPSLNAAKHAVLPTPKFNMPRKTGGGG